MKKRFKGYAYARVSSESQAERGTSIPSQLELIRNYAKQNNITIIKEFVDEAESATTDQRPQFQQMIALCKNNTQGIDSILVWKLSRFARNRIDSVVYKKLLSKEGIRVISVSEPIEDTPEGRILEGMIELIDNYYSETLSKETLRGLKQAAKQGYHTGGQPPYGYKLKTVTAGNTTKTVWQINPKEAEAVKLIYKMYDDGHTYKEIIDPLGKKGYQPRIKEEWKETSIAAVLNKRCYSGTHYFNIRKTSELGKRVFNTAEKDKEEWVSVKVPQIIDEATFNSVKEKMAKRKFVMTKRPTTQILSGLLRCGKCGQPYRAITYQRKFPYYRCSTKAVKGSEACDNRNLNANKIDQGILALTLNNIFAKENMQRYRTLIDSSIKDEKKELQAQINRLNKQQAELEKKKNVYYEGLEKGKLDISLVGERLQQLKNEEEKIITQKLEAEEALQELPDTKNYTLTEKQYNELRKDLQAFVAEGNLQQKRRFLSNFIHTITVHPNKITIEYSPPIFTSPQTLKEETDFNFPSPPGSRQ